MSVACLLLAAAGTGFLLGMAIALNIYLLPRPRLWGFYVVDDPRE